MFKNLERKVEFFKTFSSCTKLFSVELKSSWAKDPSMWKSEILHLAPAGGTHPTGHQKQDPPPLLSISLKKRERV